MLEKGKRVYVFLGDNPDCATNYDNIMYNFDPISFLPIVPELTHAIIKHIDIIPSTKYYDLIKNLESEIQGTNYFTNQDSNATSLIKVADSDKVVAQSMKYENGEIVFLPSLYETESASMSAYVSYKKVLDAIVAHEEKLNQSIDFTLPPWANALQSPDEKARLISLKELQGKKENIILEIEEQESKIKELEEYKQLFTATGKPFENIVRKTLENLGFTFTETEYNRTDLIAKFDGKAFVIEVKGVTGSAAEKNAVQLEKWASEYFEKYDCHAKSILIINAFRETPLSERNEPVFPNQMLKYAKSREQCLITGIQFLCMSLDIEANPEKKDEILEELFNTVGIYEKYADFENYLALSEEEPN